MITLILIIATKILMITKRMKTAKDVNEWYGKADWEEKAVYILICILVCVIFFCLILAAAYTILNTLIF